MIREEGKASDNEIATALSRYCAYLVAFLPYFLPENKKTIHMVLQSVLKQARTRMPKVRMHAEPHGVLHKVKHLLGITKSMSTEDKCRMIRNLRLANDNVSLTTFEKGVKLGRQLARLDTRLRWKVMAEFWAETILYVAPSDNVPAHLEHLAKGGEFVTHVWTMLSNARILKRERQDPPPPPQETPQPEATQQPPVTPQAASESGGRAANPLLRVPQSIVHGILSFARGFCTVLVGTTMFLLTLGLVSILDTFTRFVWLWLLNLPPLKNLFNVFSSFLKELQNVFSSVKNIFIALLSLALLYIVFLFWKKLLIVFLALVSLYCFKGRLFIVFLAFWYYYLR